MLPTVNSVACDVSHITTTPLPKKYPALYHHHATKKVPNTLVGHLGNASHTTQPPPTHPPQIPHRPDNFAPHNTHPTISTTQPHSPQIPHRPDNSTPNNTHPTISTTQPHPPHRPQHCARTASPSPQRRKIVRPDNRSPPTAATPLPLSTSLLSSRAVRLPTCSSS